MCYSSENNLADDTNVFNSKIGLNSLYILPGQQVTIVRPSAQKLLYLSLNKDDFYDENDQKIDTQIENLDHDIIIKASDHVRVFEFVMIDITEDEQYIIIYNTIDKDITLDYRTFNYSVTKFAIYYIYGPDETYHIKLRSTNISPNYDNFKVFGYRLRKYVICPACLYFKDYLIISRSVDGEFDFVQNKLRANNMITEKVITNVEKDFYFNINKIHISSAEDGALQLNNDYDTDILISSDSVTPLLIYNHDKFIDENGNKLLTAYADKKVITISKNSPIFLEERENWKMNLKYYDVTGKVDYVDFLDFSGAKLFSLNKELEPGKNIYLFLSFHQIQNQAFASMAIIMALLVILQKKLTKHSFWIQMTKSFFILSLTPKNL